MLGGRHELIDNMYITQVDRSRGTTYESCVRVPLVVRGPGIEAGQRSDEPVNGVDLFATILELAGLDVPKTVPNSTGDAMLPLDAVSLKPILFGDAKSLRDPNQDYLLAETQNPVRQNMRQVGARNGSYKVICTNSAAADA